MFRQQGKQGEGVVSFAPVHLNGQTRKLSHTTSGSAIISKVVPGRTSFPQEDGRAKRPLSPCAITG